MNHDFSITESDIEKVLVYVMFSCDSVGSLLEKLFTTSGYECLYTISPETIYNILLILQSRRLVSEIHLYGSIPCAMKITLTGTAYTYFSSKDAAENKAKLENTDKKVEHTSKIVSTIASFTTISTFFAKCIGFLPKLFH